MSLIDPVDVVMNCLGKQRVCVKCSHLNMTVNFSLTVFHKVLIVDPFK